MKKNKIILMISMIIFLLALYAVSHLEIESNMEDMLPSDSESLMATQSFNKYFDSSDQVMIIVTADELYLDDAQQAFHETSKQFLEELSEILKKEDYINSVMYKIDLNEIKEFEWAYLDASVYESITFAIDQNNIQAIETILKEVEQSKHTIDKNEYIVSETKKHYMMMIKPLIDQKNFIESREAFYAGVNNHIDRLIQEDRYKTLDVGLTGGAFIQDLESDKIAFDSLFETLIVTILLILIVVIAFFGSLKLPALAMYPLLLGTLLAGACAYLIYGSINMFSISFALLLMGLGIDFAVHILARYQEEKLNGKSLDDAVMIAKKSTGSSIVIGAITTAIAFGSFSIAKFKAFEQMGIISAIGLICLCLVMLILIPVLVRLFDKSSSKIRTKRMFAWLEHYTNWISKHGKLVVITILLICIGLFSTVMDTKMETELSAIYPDDLPSLEWVEVVEEAFNHNINSLSLYVDDFESLVRVVDELKNREDIKNVDSLLDYLPSHMTKKLTVVSRLDDYLKTYGMDLFTEYQLKEMTINDLPKEIKNNYIGKEGKLRLEVVPNIDIYNQKDYEVLMAAIKEIAGRQPVGIPTIMNEVTLLVKEDMIKISIVCLIIVFVVAWIAFKKMKYAMLTVLPLILTLYFTLGILPLLKIQINVFSIAAFPLIIGIGIDSAIHLIHRLEDDSELLLSQKVSNTGKAIILTALTSIIGFGSLANINHPGMSNLGLTVVVGMAMSIVFTLTVIPMGYAFLNK
ncbi:MAG: MMPL family transporter [Clostridiales bacterium]|nr:MMPL family transporter [Clostridiales bacterium]